MADAERKLRVVLEWAQANEGALKSARANLDSVVKALSDSDQRAKSAAKGIQETGKAMDSLGASAKKGSEGVEGVNTGLKETGKAADQAAQGAKKAGDAVKEVGDKAQEVKSNLTAISVALSALGGAIVGGFGAAIKTASEFQATMSSVQAVSGATAAEYDKLRAKALELGRTTRYTASQVAEGMKYLAMAGLSVGQIHEAIGSVLQLAQAGAMDLGRAADIATNIMTGFRMKAEDLAHVNDVLVKTFTSTNSTLEELGYAFSYVGPIASGVGAEFEEVAAALGLLHNAGLKGSMAGTSLRGALDTLLNPTRQEAELMKELANRIGQTTFEVKTADGRFIGFVQVLKQLEAAGIRGDEALALFGQRAGPGMAALLAQGSQALETLREQLLFSDGVASKIAQTMDNNVSGAFTRLKSALEGAAIAIAQPFMSGLQKVMDGMAAFVTKVTELYEALGPLGPIVTGLVVSFGALATAAGAWHLSAMAGVKVGAMFQALTLDIKAATAALVAFASKFAPLLIAASAIAAVTYAIERYVDRNKDALEAAQRHREALDDQVTTFSKLRATLNDANATQKEQAQALQEVSRLLPGVSVSYDTLSGDIVNLDEATRVATEALDSHIQKLREEQQAARVTELQARARVVAELSEEYADLSSQYQEVNEKLASQDQLSTKVANFLQGKFLFTVQNLTREQNALGKAMDTTNAKRQQEFDILTRQLRIYEDMSRAEFEAMVSTMEVSEQTKEVLLAAFDAMKSGAADFASSMRQATDESKRGTEEFAEAVKKVKEEVKSLAESAESQKKALAGMYDEAIERTKVMASNEQSVAQQIIELHRAKKDALIAAADEYVREATALIQQTVSSEREAAQLSADVQRQAIQDKLAAYREYISAVRGFLQEAVAAERSAAQEIQSIRDRMRQTEMSGEEAIQRLRERTMSQQEQYASRLARANELLAKAQEELGKGTAEGFKNAEQYANKAVSAFEALPAEVKEGEQVIVSAAESQQTALKGIEQAIQLVTKAQESQLATASQKYEDAKQKVAELRATLDEAYAAVERLRAEQINIEGSVNVDTTALEDARRKIEEVKNSVPLDGVEFKINFMGEYNPTVGLGQAVQDVKALLASLSGGENKVVITADMTAVTTAVEQIQQMLAALTAEQPPIVLTADTSDVVAKIEEVMGLLEALQNQPPIAIAMDTSGAIDALNELAKMIDGLATTIVGVSEAAAEIGQALSAGISRASVSIQALVTQIHQVKTLIHSLENEQINVEVKFHADAEEVLRVKEELKQTTHSTHVIHVKRVEEDAAGGLVGGYARGGFVRNLINGIARVRDIFRPSGTDTVPAMLTPGEFVLPVKAVRYYGLGLLEAMRSLMVPRQALAFAGGGMVPAGVQALAPTVGEGGSLGSMTVRFRLDEEEYPVDVKGESSQTMTDFLKALKRKRLVSNTRGRMTER